MDLLHTVRQSVAVTAVVAGTAATATTATTATVALLQPKAGHYIITTSSGKNSHKSREHKYLRGGRWWR